MTSQTLKTFPVANDASLAQGTYFLKTLDNDWAQLIDLVGPCQLYFKAEREPYEALVRAVAYQQLHTKAGDAIMQRFMALYTDTFPSPIHLLNTEFESLRGCGFSSRKIETIKGIAQATLLEIVPDRATAQSLSNAILIDRLITLKGIGRWSVEMFLIFTLQRLDILPIGDLGIREGYRRLKKLPLAPKPKDLALIGEAWQPYRTIASWYLWQVPK
jgi:DNA-3-methyladenine glycosylase II